MASRFKRSNIRPGFQKNETPSTGVHPSILKQARKSGQLNLSQRSLTESMPKIETVVDFSFICVIKSVFQSREHIYRRFCDAFNNTDLQLAASPSPSPPPPTKQKLSLKGFSGFWDVYYLFFGGLVLGTKRGIFR